MTTMSRASPAPARRKSILIHVHRPADRDEEDTCRRLDVLLMNSRRQLREEDTCRWDAFLMSKRIGMKEPCPPRTNGWLIIEDTATGPKISPIFHGLKQDCLIHSRGGTGCALVGSRLYGICGEGSTTGTFRYLSNKIRCLDTKKPDEGWKTEELPLYCSYPTTAVSGDSIYLFPGVSRFKFINEEQVVNEETDQLLLPWGYIYDTIEHKGRILYLPEKCNQYSPRLCAPLDGHGVRVPIRDREGDKMKWFDHRKTGWEKLDVECESLSEENLLRRPYAVSSGTLYIYDQKIGPYGVLHAYNISCWSPLGIIYLPEFAYLDEWDMVFIVPVADFELCFLWHRDDRFATDSKEISPLHYALVSICLDPKTPPTATLLKEAVLDINATGVINCLPYDSFSDDQIEVGGDDQLHMREADVSGASSSSKQNKQDQEVEFWNTRLEQYVALFQNVNSSAKVLDILLQSRNTFTQIPSDAQLPPKKKMKGPAI